MDYEEKYNEALERAKKFEEKYGGGYAEYIFPELAESEDERIRKELKEAFEAYDIESKWNGIPVRSIFAWLEKQKEPENTSASTMAPSCWEVEQKEQKPISFNVPFNPDDYEVVMEGNATGLKQKEQKPVSISCDHENDAEWGQEDKEKIVTISEIIEHCTTIPYSGGTLTLNKEYKKELLCFIRTLRPQYHGDVTMTEAYKMGLEAGKASSWKPSEEQMKALEAATARYQSTGLESLYEDLKKLI